MRSTTLEVDNGAILITARIVWFLGRLVPKIFQCWASIRSSPFAFMTIVSGADPDIVERLLGQPVVHCFAVDLDELAAFSVADRLSSRPRLLLWVDF